MRGDEAHELVDVADACGTLDLRKGLSWRRGGGGGEGGGVEMEALEVEVEGRRRWRRT